MQVLIPMAGAGRRFQEQGYTVPKPLILVSDRPMFVKAVQDMPKGDRYIFLCREEHLGRYDLGKELKHYFPQAEVIPLATSTEGQAATCLLAEDHLDREGPLLIGAPDNGMLWTHDRWERLIQEQGIAAVIWTFRNNPLVKRNPAMYGWVKQAENGRVQGVSCKVPISAEPMNDHAVIGTFWFRKAQYFLDSAKRMIQKDIRIDQEFYVDLVFNELIAAGSKVGIFEVDKYIGWGTPEDLKTYEYWERYFAKK